MNIRQKKSLFSGTVFSLFLLVSNTLYGNTVYVKSKKLKLLEKPQNSSTVVHEVPQGAKLEVDSTKGLWLRVEVERDGKRLKGWAMKLLTSPNPPLNGSTSSLLKKSKVDISKNARKRASALTSVAAARGLMEDTSKTMTKLKEANYERLTKLYQTHQLEGPEYVFEK